ncbi:MAG: rhodanese-like domain-containing protein [Bdellovibrionaceae bacterium]|nr:rhodanese-like domain-containing protein [Pseudobdellovibrionaceae bacterium]
MKHILAMLCVTALVVVSAQAGEAVGDISHEELKAAIASKQVVLLDVNGSSSYAAGHIPGAIDFEVAHADLAKHLPAEKDALIVAYCGSPACKAYLRGAKAAMALGYTNVKHYSGGISGWKKAKEEVEKSS